MPRPGIGARLRRLAVRVAALTIACGAAIPVLTVSPAAAQPPAADSALGNEAVQEFGGCLLGKKAGSLLMLVDESASLRSSDGGDPPARVVAAKYLLRQLQDSTGRANVQLDVAVGTFAADYKEVQNWTTLDPSSLGGIVTKVDQLATHNTGFETDYVTALEGARQTLIAHAAQRPAAGSCRAIAWFTDGEMYIRQRTTDDDRARFGTTKPYAEGVDLGTASGRDTAQTKAQDEICRNGGLADQLRSGGVTTFAVGLAGLEATPRTFDLLSAIATGQPAGGVACGAITSPPPGFFERAANIDDLLFAFDRVLNPTPPVDTPICGSTVRNCTGHQFVLDETIHGVHILASSDRPGIDVRLIGPDAASYDLTPTRIGDTQTLEAHGVSVEYSWQSDRTVSIDLKTSDPARWKGVWALLFVDPSTPTSTGSARSNIHIWGDLIPAWLDRPAGPLNSGQVIKDVRLGVTRLDGSPFRAADAPGTLSLSAVLVQRDGTQMEVIDQVDKDRIGAPVDLDLRNVKPGDATLRMVLNVTTAPTTPPGGGAMVPGTPLAPQQLDISVPVTTPVGYPSVATSLDFGTANGETELTADLPVTGPGCVWLPADPAPTVVTQPGDVTSIAITTPTATTAGKCLAVGDGQRSVLPLRLAADRTGNGTVSGTLTVAVAPPNDPGKATTVPVAFTANMVKPLKAPNFILALLALLLLGPGIPLGLLYLAKWFTAKIPSQGMHAVRIPVTVSYGEVLRDSARFHLGPHDTVRLVPTDSGGMRHLDGLALGVPGLTLRTRIGRSPFGPGYTVVQAPPWMVSTSEDPISYGDGSEGRLPLAVHDKFIVLHDPIGPAESAVVVVLISAGSSPAQLEVLAQRVRDLVPDRVEQMRRSAADRAARGQLNLVGAGVGAPPDAGGYAPGYGPLPGPPVPPGPGSASGYGPPDGSYPGPPAPPRP